MSSNNNSVHHFKSMEFGSSMRPMDRPLKPEPEKFPKHTVNSLTKPLNISENVKTDPTSAILGRSGITYSSEDKAKSSDSEAEYNVLRAILNRENYLNKLQNVARTVGQKFKPEVADALDLVRASSLDVIDSILRWRDIKVRINYIIIFFY